MIRSPTDTGFPTEDPVVPLPADGAAAVVANLTATNPTAGGYVTMAGGAVGLQLGSFVERVAIVDYASGGWSGGEHVPARTLEAEVYEALRIGVRDYLAKNRFPGAIIGLSGGIDSALTLAIAVDALGADKVRAVMMPSPYTAQMSLDDSRDMVARLGVRYDEIAIEPAMKVFAELLADQFAGLPADTTGQQPAVPRHRRRQPQLEADAPWVKMKPLFTT